MKVMASNICSAKKSGERVYPAKKHRGGVSRNA